MDCLFGLLQNSDGDAESDSGCIRTPNWVGFIIMNFYTNIENFIEAGRFDLPRRASQPPRWKGHGKWDIFRGGSMPTSVNQIKKEEDPWISLVSPSTGPPSPSTRRCRCSCSPTSACSLDCAQPWDLAAESRLLLAESVTSEPDLPPH
jgi:hypothetical protein